MGLKIKRNEKGLYNMESSITDSSIHPGELPMSKDDGLREINSPSF